MNNSLGVSPSKGNQGTTRGKEYIGTQSVQELFFVIGAFVELFTVMI